MATRTIKGVIGNVSELNIKFFGKSIHGQRDGQYGMIIDKDSLINLAKKEAMTFKILHIEEENTESNIHSFEDQMTIFMRDMDTKHECALIMKIERLWDLGEEMCPKPPKKPNEISLSELDKLKSLFFRGKEISIMIKDAKGVTEKNRKEYLEGKKIVILID